MGFPLSIFTGGHLLLPYACLQQHSTLQDISKHSGFVAASSNVLFRGKNRDNSNDYFNTKPCLMKIGFSSAPFVRRCD